MATSEFTISEARLVGLFMQSVFFGVYLVSFVALIRVLFFGGRARVIHRPMLMAAIAMFIVATLGVTSLLKLNIDAFINFHGSGGPDAAFEVISNPINVLLFATYYAQTIIGDLILIYRCYIVYNRSWLVIFLPFVVWLATLGCSCVGIFKTNTLDTSTNIDDESLIPWITSILILTMVQNFATTSLIAWRIWKVDQQARQHGRNSRLQQVFRMVIESGAIYTMSVFVLLVTYLCSNNAQYPVSNCIAQIIGIVFNTIIIRVHQGRTADQEATTVTVETHSMSFSHDTFRSTIQHRNTHGPENIRSIPAGGAGHPQAVTVHMNIIQQTRSESDMSEHVSAGDVSKGDKHGSEAV